jgi:hypothetical protein
MVVIKPERREASIASRPMEVTRASSKASPETTRAPEAA